MGRRRQGKWLEPGCRPALAAGSVVPKWRGWGRSQRGRGPAAAPGRGGGTAGESYPSFSPRFILVPQATARHSAGCLRSLPPPPGIPTLPPAATSRGRGRSLPPQPRTPLRPTPPPRLACGAPGSRRQPVARGRPPGIPHSPFRAGGAAHPPPTARERISAPGQQGPATPAATGRHAPAGAAYAADLLSILPAPATPPLLLYLAAPRAAA